MAPAENYSDGGSGRSLAVRQAAAKTAVKASERTGRPVAPRVRALAESAPKMDSGRTNGSGFWG
ncbi:hypothetical protein D2E64_12805 [Mycobacteroides abscessus]|nr:hypothetical protein DDJ76_22715 [Mycobacteroides abscessus]RIS03892.1 hypothetical protein D2E63_22345 [Mycobacteroides abscessus]RIS11353.1 hypothetical protein D2E69_22475 [Mycobacteroides abscessus]RIS23542.1 hypothetical protein D2E67_21980 [Mycobacteroides abscessus]RIT14757.1 hypothetical protein D2E64_12805 [Mycobacteroides abscessus]